MASEIIACPKSTLEWVLHEKSTKMHWYNYRMEGNFGGGKCWQIWQMTINSPNFPCLTIQNNHT